MSATYSANLARVAITTNTRIAVPESSTPCKGAAWKSCWPAETSADVALTWNDVVSSSMRCFESTAPFTLVGFSNGGYFAAKIAMRCSPNGPPRIIAIGSAGDIANARGNDLSPCPPLSLMIGDRDGTRRAAKDFAAALRKRGLPVHFETFPGGHEVPWDRLERALQADPAP